MRTLRTQAKTHHGVAVVIALVIAPNVSGGIVSYECNSLPAEAGWDVFSIYCDAERAIEDGWFVVRVELCDANPPPGGQSAGYTRSLAEFTGVPTFFVEWRMETDGDRSELPWGGPCNLSVSSFGAVNYRFSIASDQMDLNRDNTLPIVVAEFEAGVPHTHRLELYDDELYVWYLDGTIVDAGVPEGSFPSYTPAINWRTKAAWLPNTTRWDYIRYGTIPEDGSGNYDSDGRVDLTDYYFVQECFVSGGPGIDSGPSCRVVDMDGDSDTDLRDLAAFQNAFTGPE